MPELTAKDVTKIVRDYFDEIKKSKFIFDVIRVEYFKKGGVWEVECEVSNVFEEAPKHYMINVNDESGDIMDVNEITEEDED